MGNYTCLMGIVTLETAARDYGELVSQPTRGAEDDGAIILHAGEHPPQCRDCSCGHLLWAEAGYVPWHRICDRCGAHWELHPIRWGPARPSSTFQVKTPLPNHEGGCDICNGPRPCSCGREAEIAVAKRRAAESLRESGGLVRWVDGRGEVPLNPDEQIHPDCPHTWGELVALITPEMWEAAEKNRDRNAGMAIVPAAWARRARFF